MTAVKICGHTTVEDVRGTVAAGADAVGVIVDVPVDTPREVSITQASILFDAVPPFETSVLVTMVETPERALELVDQTQPDALQLHSPLPTGDLAYLRSELDTPLLVTVPADDPEQIAAVGEIADGILVDSVDEDGAGGTGETHDWERTRDAIQEQSTPVILAGGLTPDNISAAVDVVDPYGVDVASGVESGGGRKDHDAVEAFVRNATKRNDPPRQ